jgi:hypothetical protein
VATTHDANAAMDKRTTMTSDSTRTLTLEIDRGKIDAVASLIDSSKHPGTAALHTSRKHVWINRRAAPA